MPPVSIDQLNEAYAKVVSKACGSRVYDERRRQYVDDGIGILHTIPTFLSHLHPEMDLPADSPVVYANLPPGWRGHDGWAERGDGQLRAVVARETVGYRWRVTCAHGPEQGDQVEVGRGYGDSFEEAAALADTVFAQAIGAALTLDIASARDRK